jgi:hypothetical protein
VSPGLHRVRVTGRDAGALRLSEPHAAGEEGAPLINAQGTLIGVGGRGATATLSARVTALLNTARQNVVANQLATIDQIARRESHAFGSALIRSDVTGAQARVTPLDRQWPETARTDALPMTFSGPMGRYQAELLVDGSVRATSTITVQPGQSTPITLNPTAVTEQAQQQDPAQIPAGQVRGGGGGFPWPVLLIVGAGGGAAAYFLTKGGGDGGGGGGGRTLIFRIPNP